MRIGFDIDGVLADFIGSYQRLFVEESGGNLFGPSDHIDPPCWDWPQYRGYSDSVVGRVWARITADDTFWMNLNPMGNVLTLGQMLYELERKHEVYFITNRAGLRVKRQTEIWLIDHLRYPARCQGVFPTVLVSSAKGVMCKALNLDVYIDDNYENCADAKLTSPTTRTYMLDRLYNRQTRVNNVLVNYAPLAGVPKVKTLGEMFDTELANL